MEFRSACYTDIGVRKKTNQDALLLLHARDPEGQEMVLAAICDGVGGLKMGELASALVVQQLHQWFCQRMPQLCRDPDPEGEIFREWAQLIEEVHGALKTFSEEKGFQLGTTVEILLLLAGRYYICHVGDCRVYSLTDCFTQLTKDHSLVQQEIDAGRLTPEQARRDPRQNLLWQCVGAGELPNPDFLYGTVEPGQSFLLCCDGFRRRVTAGELENFCRSTEEDRMAQGLEKVTRRCERRGETDNITSILVHSCRPRRSLWGLLHPEPQPAGTGQFRLTREILEEHAHAGVPEQGK